MISSDAVVKIAGLPITLQTPDFLGTYEKVSADVDCAKSTGGQIKEGEITAAGCLGKIEVPDPSTIKSLIPQFHGPIDRSVSPRDVGVEFGRFSIPKNILPIPSLPSLPLSGTLRVTLEKADTAIVHAHVQLPGVLEDGNGNALTGNVNLAISNRKGLELDAFDIFVPSLAQVGLARLKELFFRYQRPSYFEGSGKVDLSDVIKGNIKIHFVINDSKFRSGEVTYTGDVGGGIPLTQPIYLTRLEAGLSLDPVKISGDTQLSVGPAANAAGCGTLGIHGHADIVFQNPVSIDASGALSALCVDLGPTRYFHADSNGYVEVGQSIRLDIPGFATVSGLQSGSAFGSVHVPARAGDQLSLQLDGQLSATVTIEACVAGVCEKRSLSAGADATFALGYKYSGHGLRFEDLKGGAGICAHLRLRALGTDFGFDVGAGVDDLPKALLAIGTNNFAALATKVVLLESGCDVARWRFWKPIGAVRASAGAASYGIDVPAGQKVAAIGVQGDGGAPKVTLRGPGGVEIHTGGDGLSIRNGALVVRQPSSGQTLIQIPGAKAGRWVLVPDPDPDSPPIKSVRSTQQLERPRIITKVTGRGARRALHYRISPQPGLSVQFLEGVGRGTSPIGVARGASGAIRFTPALGSPRQRKILARIRRTGVTRPQPTFVVGRYRPGVIRAGRALRIKVRRVRGRWRISWVPGALATSQLLTIRFADGAQVLVPATGRQRVLLIPRALGREQPVAVSIVALRGQQRGRPVTVVARAKALRRAARPSTG